MDRSALERSSRRRPVASGRLATFRPFSIRELFLSPSTEYTTAKHGCVRPSKITVGIGSNAEQNLRKHTQGNSGNTQKCPGLISVSPDPLEGLCHFESASESCIAVTT